MLTAERCLEALMWAEGRWEDVLRYLARKLPGEAPPEKWYRTEKTSVRRIYTCRICGDRIDSESAKYPQTQHANRALSNHGAKHLEEVRGTLGM